MSSAARSAYVFGIYLIVIGGMAMGAPNTLLALLRLEPTIDAAGALYRHGTQSHPQFGLCSTAICRELRSQD